MKKIILLLSFILSMHLCIVPMGISLEVQLCNSIVWNKIENVKKILEQPINVNFICTVPATPAPTPLTLAIGKESLPIIKLLMHAGADLDFFDGDERPPLVNTFSPFKEEILKLLLNAGAQYEKPVGNGQYPDRTDGMTPRAIAQKYYPDASKIIERFDKNKKALFRAIEHNNIGIIKNLSKESESGAFTFMLFDQNGDTPLHKAVAAKQIEIIKFILATNPELASIKNKNGQIPIELAVGFGLDDILLLFRKAAFGEEKNDLPNLLNQLNIELQMLNNQLKLIQ